jgi:hypothetical protein
VHDLGDGLTMGVFAFVVEFGEGFVGVFDAVVAD